MSKKVSLGTWIMKIKFEEHCLMYTSCFIQNNNILISHIFVSYLAIFYACMFLTASWWFLMTSALLSSVSKSRSSSDLPHQQFLTQLITPLKHSLLLASGHHILLLPCWWVCLPCWYFSLCPRTSLLCVWPLLLSSICPHNLGISTCQWLLNLHPQLISVESRPVYLHWPPASRSQ